MHISKNHVHFTYIQLFVNYTIIKLKANKNKINKCRKYLEVKNRKKFQGQQIENSINMADINPNISIITFNINTLILPIQRQRLSFIRH